MVVSAERAPLRVIGRYALYGEIAAGGMATVHIGRLLGPVGFSRTVAIKRLHPQYAKDPEFVSMFLDEARVAARIQHPNVVGTLDVVALEGELFLVMEYVEGEALARVLHAMRREKRRVPPKIAGAIVVNLLNGLHAAHEATSERGDPLSIVHRDVSPQNVLIGIDGIARVLDFGVAKAAGRVQTTREGQVKGKIAYMPPEQIAGEKVDRRLDVYAAAVVLWEALTAQRLFDGDNDAVVLSNVLSGEVKPPSAIVSGLPPGVDEVVMRGLSRNPKYRYPTAAEMAVAVEDSLGIESPRKVSEFLQSCVGDAMAKRAARVKEIESNDLTEKLPADAGETAAEPTGSLRPIFAPEESRSSGEIVAAKAATAAADRRKRMGLIAIAAVGGAALLVLLFVFAFGKKPETTAAASATPSAARTAPAPFSSSPPPVIQTAAAIVSAAPSEAATVASAAASATPPATPSALWGRLPSGAWTPPGGKKPDCTQPKVFVNGIWKFRPECMNQ